MHHFNPLRSLISNSFTANFYREVLLIPITQTRRIRSSGSTRCLREWDVKRASIAMYCASSFVDIKVWLFWAICISQHTLLHERLTDVSNVVVLSQRGCFLSYGRLFSDAIYYQQISQAFNNSITPLWLSGKAPHL